MVGNKCLSQVLHILFNKCTIPQLCYRILESLQWCLFLGLSWVKNRTLRWSRYFSVLVGTSLSSAVGCCQNTLCFRHHTMHLSVSSRLFFCWTCMHQTVSKVIEHRLDFLRSSYHESGLQFPSGTVQTFRLYIQRFAK